VFGVFITESIALQFNLSQNMESFLQVAVELASAINALHGYKVVHNDIKPRNLLFHWNKKLLIIDFDIARKFDDTSSLANRTDEVHPMGTLQYMSPEQTGRLGIRADYRTDLYSLGVVFYQYLTGKLPFEQSSLMELVHAIISTPPVDANQLNPEVPQQIANIINRLLMKSPDSRYQSAFGLMRDLQRCLAEFRLKKTIETFELGVYDKPIVFRFSPHLLFGREKEQATVLEIYDNVRFTGEKRALMLAGRAGVGKSSLLWPLQQKVPLDAFFIIGKFEFNKRHIPYSAFVQAFSQLASTLLTMKESEIERYRTHLLTALGQSGQVILDVIPEFEKIIGPQVMIANLQSHLHVTLELTKTGYSHQYLKCLPPRLKIDSQTCFSVSLPYLRMMKSLWY